MRIILATDQTFPSPIVVVADEPVHVLLLESPVDDEGTHVIHDSISHHVIDAVVNIDPETVTEIFSQYTDQELVRLETTIKRIKELRNGHRPLLPV